MSPTLTQSAPIRRPVLAERVTIERRVYLSVREAIRLLDVSESRFYLLLRAEEFRSVVPPGSPRRYVLLDDVERYARRRDDWLRLHGRA